MPGREVYVEAAQRQGLAEQCRNSGRRIRLMDLLSNFSMNLCDESGWRVEPDVVIESDFDWTASKVRRNAAQEQFAWFWRGTEMPHVISDNVYDRSKIR